MMYAYVRFCESPPPRLSITISTALQCKPYQMMLYGVAARVNIHKNENETMVSCEDEMKNNNHF